MNLLLFLLSCHSVRSLGLNERLGQPWGELDWQPETNNAPRIAIEHGFDELEDAWRAATALLAIERLSEAQRAPLLGYPVVFSRETTGWDGERCFSTALPMPDQEGCYLLPFELAALDTVWLRSPSRPAAVRPAVFGSAHGLTFVCLPEEDRPSPWLRPKDGRTPVARVPGGVPDEQCPNAPTMALATGETASWVRFSIDTIPMERLELLLEDPPAWRQASPAERLWEQSTARADGVEFFRVRDRISGVSVVAPTEFVRPGTSNRRSSRLLYDLNASGVYELEVLVSVTGGLVGRFDGDEDGSIDSCWFWDSSASPAPSWIVLQEDCPDPRGGP